MLKMLIPIAAAAVVCGAALTGCSFASKSTKEAIRICSERYGVDMKLKSKKLLAGGADCDIYVTCNDLPDKKVHIFQLDSHSYVNCDYISVKYSDRLYEQTVTAVSGVKAAKYQSEPEWNIIVHEDDYNHFPSADFDGTTTFEQYMSESPLNVYVVIPEPQETDKMSGIHDDVKAALDKAGIDVKLLIYSMKDSASAKNVGQYDHVTERMEFSGVSSHDTYSFCFMENGKLRSEKK